MTHDTAFPFLTVLVLLPAGAALAVALVPGVAGRARPAHGGARPSGWRRSLATLALAVTIAVRYHAGNGGYRLVSQHEWAPVAGHLVASGRRRHLGVPASSWRPCCSPWSCWPARRRADPRSFVAWMLLLEAACLGSFVSLDLILFFLFFELTLVPVYFVIAGWGFARPGLRGDQVLRLHLPRLGLPAGGDRGRGLHPRAPDRPPDLRPGGAHAPPIWAWPSQVLLFLAFTAAFAVKAPIFPFHTWSPDAYAESPTGGVGHPGRA